MDETWTINELVEQVGERIAALPAPKNGQVRAVPDDRTIRYYGAIGLIDRPVAMRGRTALYGRKHVAQIVAIKRLQAMGRSLAEIQTLWPTLDDATLSRMSGVELASTAAAKKSARKDFWKEAPAIVPPAPIEAPPHVTPAPLPRAVARYTSPRASVLPAYIPAPELRIELAPNLFISIAMSGDVAISQADVAAIRAAAAPLIAELASRQLAVHADEGDDV